MPLPQTGSGIEVLVYSDEGTAGRLAQNISADLSAVGWTDLGVKERPGLIVLRKTRLDTLAFDYILPTTRRIPDLHRLETCAAGRTQKQHPVYFEKKIHRVLFDVFHVNEIHSSFFDVWFSYGLIPTTFLVYWTWKKCASLRPGTAGGCAGTAGGKFYVDELQTAIFLVYYCDGRDVREEEKYGI